jgi:hypothetical protein
MKEEFEAETLLPLIEAFEGWACECCGVWTRWVTADGRSVCKSCSGREEEDE